MMRHALPVLALLAWLLPGACPVLAQDLKDPMPEGGSKPPPVEAPVQAQPISQCPDNMQVFGGSDERLTCTCPAELTNRGSVWGTDAYTADSATCQAALHAGAVSRRGGEVTLQMLPGQPRYPGTTRNGVQSHNRSAYRASYRFEGGPQPAAGQPGQCPDNLVAYSGTDEVLTCACPAEMTNRGTVWGTDTYTTDSATCHAAVHAGLLSRRGGTVTLQVLPGEPRYPGTTRNGVQSNNRGTYAASYRFQPDPNAPPPQGQAQAGQPQQCPDNMAAYNGSDEALTCTCPAERMTAGAVWGTDVYTSDTATCAAALHAGMLNRRGGQVTVQMLPGQPRYPGTTRNGVQSSNYGTYAASYRFQPDPNAPQPQGQGQAQGQGQGQAQSGAPSQCPDNMSAYANSDETVTCTCPAERLGSGAVWGTDTYTADSATCRSALHAGALNRRGGTVIVQMLPGQPRYPGTTRNGVESSNYGTYAASYRFQADPNAPPQAQAQAQGQSAPPAQCPDNMSAYVNTDEVLTCICPAELTGRGSVWGTDTYTADSATCRAAVHAGALNNRGGTVTLEMLPGQPRYPGTTRNGIQSSNYASYRGSYRFRIEPKQRTEAAPREAAAPSQCPDNLSAYANSDEVLTCICPGEMTLRGSVWGTDTYTADSATCRAAVHAGIIGVTGGTVTAQMLPGEPRYPGTTRNGIQSSNYGSYRASYRFQGGQRAQGPVQAAVAETLNRTGQVQLYVTFRTNSADLDISAAPVLMQVRDAMLADPRLRLRLVGHTDSTGTAAINTPLSLKRAESVRQWLIANGVGADRLASEGRGPSEPIADNTNEAGRSLNRRVQAVRLQ